MIDDIIALILSLILTIAPGAIFIPLIVRYFKEYETINKRYWGVNKGKPDEAVAKLILFILATTALGIWGTVEAVARLFFHKTFFF